MLDRAHTCRRTTHRLGGVSVGADTAPPVLCFLTCRFDLIDPDGIRRPDLSIAYLPDMAALDQNLEPVHERIETGIQ